MIQGACRKISIPAPSAVISSTDVNVLLLLELAQDEGKELMRDYDWQELRKEATHTTIASLDQGALNGGIVTAGDFDRFVDETMWNRTQDRRVVGPATSSTWQALIALESTTIEQNFRVMEGNLLIGPTVPTAGETLAWEYVSRNFCQSSGGTGQASWQADTDTGVLDEDLMQKGLVWRFKKDKGFPYAEDMTTYEREKMKLKGQNEGAPDLSLGGAFHVFDYNIPDRNWPGT